MKWVVAACAFLLVPAPARAQDAGHTGGFLGTAKHAYETLFTKSVRISLEPIAPTSGVVLGIGYRPKPWRAANVFKIPVARAAFSQHKYWAIDGSFAWQGVGEREWRVEPYARFRSMKRLNYFGLGGESNEADRATYALLERRAGAYGYMRPVGWLAVGGRGERLWMSASGGQNPDVPSVELAFPPSALAGFAESIHYLHISGFVNVNYPYVRSERPRRGGDYMASFGLYRDVSGASHSFTRVEVEGHERFTVFGTGRQLTLHARLSSSTAASGRSVPFYMLDTLGGADNLRGFQEEIVGGDETTATLRPFESFRFRDLATIFFQIEFRQRVGMSPVFVSFFADAGSVGSGVRRLSTVGLRRGAGVGVGLYRANALAIRAEFSLWGGEGHPRYVTTGRGLQF
jgi:hypothetical protein